MSSLYKRATPAQAYILRVVAGAVMNVAHYHPEYGLTERKARSIAKRAAGTLTAQWPEVLAAREVPSQGNGGPFVKPSCRSPEYAMATNGGRRTWVRRSPFKLLKRDLGIAAGAARRAGNNERAEAFVDTLRMIAKLEGKT